MPLKAPTHAALLREQHPELAPHRAPLDDRAAESKRLYASSRWLRLRRVVLAKRPLCEACLRAGVTMQANEVNHRVALRDGGAPFDEANLELLCKPCHSRATQTEQAARRRAL